LPNRPEPVFNAPRRARRLAPRLLLAAFLWATAAPAAHALVGDCNGDGVVRISELVIGVLIALDETPLTRCPSFDVNGDGTVSIDELISGVAAALEPEPTPTPLAQVLDFGVVGGQPCSTTQVSFAIPDGLSVTVTAMRIDFCVDPNAFKVADVTCTSFSNTVVIDAVDHFPSCTLDAPVNPSGQVQVAAHGTGGDAGNAFQPFDEIDCVIPVPPTTAGGDYPIRYRVVAQTSLGEVINVGDGTITVFGLDPTGRFRGECCTEDGQCESGFCRGGDSTQYNACCESDCPGGVCNVQAFPGQCCDPNQLPSCVP